MPSVSNPSPGSMVDSTVSKFTKLLPLSIRKEGSSGVVVPGGFQDAASSSSSGVGHPHHHLQTAEMKELVRVSVVYPSAACGAMNPHKDITVRLTNDDNPMFFYHLRISDAEFPELKSQQGLLVDFYGFPNQLVTLLEKCDPNYSGGDTGGGEILNGSCGSGPRFVLVMKIRNDVSVLDIVESNPFKYLCHLSLQINAGSDGEVKKYLCDVTTTLKKEQQLLREKYGHLASTMEDETTRLKSQLEMRGKELGELRDQLHAQANSLSTKHFEDMTQEKERLLRLQSELASKFESEKNELDRRHNQAIISLEERISTLEAENRDLLQTKYKHETALQDSSNRRKHNEEDLKLLQQEITLTKKQNEKLDHDYHEKQRLTNNLQNRVSNLELDVKEKQAMLQRQHEQIMQMSEQKKFLEEHATAMVKEVEKVKNANKLVSAELIKANEIIKKLQDDIRNLNSKCKIQSHVTVQQERTITDQDKEIKQLQSDLASLAASHSSAETEATNLKEKLGDSEAKVTELEKNIRSNENMISWLNKQLNEYQGLSNLSKFRQNLATSAPLPSDANGDIGQGNPSSDAAVLYNDHLTSTNPKANRPYQYGHAHDGDSIQSGRHFLAGGGAAFNHNRFQNTLPNGTPSWMHIYQSTSTPLEDDLSSRLEKVAASSGLHLNYKSRFTDRYQGDDNGNENGNPSTSDKKENEDTGVGAKPATSRPPTWARVRGGKVTLGSVGLAGSRGVGTGFRK